MKSQAHLLMSRNGKVGGIDKEDHHQQKHAVDGRMEFEKPDEVETVCHAYWLSQDARRGDSELP